jgi:hypothetical protein
MKSLGIAAIILAAAPLWAGVRIKVEVTDLKSGKIVERQEVLLDADRLRIDSASDTSRRSILFLTDGGRDRMVMLDPARNEYREMDRQTMDQTSQQMQGMMAQLQSRLASLPPDQRAKMEQMMRGMAGRGGTAPAEVHTTYTAQGSASVNGFSCTRYDGMRGAEKVLEMCAAKPSDLHFNPSDFQVFERMRAFSAGFLSSLANSPLGNARVDYWTQQGIDGYPVQQVSFSGGQATTKMELKSVERAGFSDADFSLGTAKKVDLIPGRK